MKLRTKIKLGLTAAVIVSVAGVVTYKVLLDQQARESLKDAGRTIKDSYGTISSAIAERRGVLVEEDVEQLDNRIQTLKQWADLGF